MIAETIPALKYLTAEQKLILVGEIWDELAAQPNSFPPREDHVRLLRERLDHFRQHPEDTSAWEDVKARILASR
jgi:putative addiction module component (TIGR02574 family)